MSAAWLTALSALAAAIGGVLWWLLRQAWHLLSRTMRFLDDWAGEPARPGVEARPGVMERLRAVEVKLAQVLAETRPNHGHSMRDVMHAVRNDVSEIKADQAAMRGRIEQFEAERGKREGKDHA